MTPARIQRLAGTAAVGGAVLAVASGCGGSSDSVAQQQSQSQEVAAARAEGARAARQDARIERLEEQVREAGRRRQRRRASTPTASPAAAATAIPASVLAGTWTGFGMQYAPRGSTQRVVVQTTIAADGRSGTHSEYIQGERQTSSCSGTLTGGGDGSFTYREQRGADCIETTRITMVPVPDHARLQLVERYSTSVGAGRVEATMERR